MKSYFTVYKFDWPCWEKNYERERNLEVKNNEREINFEIRETIIEVREYKTNVVLKSSLAYNGNSNVDSQI